MKRQIKQKRLLIAACNTTAMLFSGLIYAWAIFVAPLEAEFGWTRADTSLTFTLSLVFSTLSASVASMVAKKTPSQRIVLCSSLVVGLSMLAVSRITVLWQLYLLYGIICAAAIGFVYNLTLGTIMPWFRDCPSLISGVLLMAFGMGGMVLGSLASVIIQRFGWRTAFVVLGVIGFLVLATCAFFIRVPNAQEEQQLGFSTAVTGDIIISHTPKEMISTPFFRRYVIWYIPIIAAGLTIANHSAPIAQTMGITVAASAVFSGVVSLCNGAGRVIFGAVLDRKGTGFTTAVVNGLTICWCLLLLLAVLLASPTLLLLAFITGGLAYGAGPVLAMGLIKGVFGTRDYAVNIGIANLTIIAGSVVGPYAGGLIYQQCGYPAVAILLVVFSLITMVFCKRIIAPKPDDLTVR